MEPLYLDPPSSGGLLAAPQASGNAQPYWMGLPSGSGLGLDFGGLAGLDPNNMNLSGLNAMVAMGSFDPRYSQLKVSTPLTRASWQDPAADKYGFMWSPTAENTNWNNYDLTTGKFQSEDPGWFHHAAGMAPEIQRYLRSVGYQGWLPDQGYANTWGKLQEQQNPTGGRPNQNDPPIEDPMGIYSRDPSGAMDELRDWMKANNVSYQVGVHQTPGATQATYMHRLIGPDGQPLVVDAYNNRFNASDRLEAAAKIAFAVAAGGAMLSGGLGGAAGATGGASAGGGISTLSPSLAGTAPTLTTASLPTGMTAGMTGGSALSYVPSAAQAFAGAGGLATLSGGAAPAITTQSIPTGLTAGMTGGSGVAPALTSAEVLGGAAGSALGSAAGTAPESFMGGVEYGSSGVPASSELFNPGAIGNTAPSTSGLFGNYGGSAMFDMGTAATSGGLTDTLMKWGGKAVDAFTSDPNAAKNWAGLLGGLAGASEGGKSQTATTTQQIDPRMAQYLYGSGYGDTNSMLGAAQQWFQNNRSGMNANMAQGLDTLKSLYTSPSYSQSYSQMRDVGQGLLGRSIAGNPFTQGGLLGAPQQMPAIQPPSAQPPRPDIGSPFGPTMEMGGGRFFELNPHLQSFQEFQMPSGGNYINEQQRMAAAQQPQQMPSPDVGIPQFPRPAWSI